MKTTWIVEYWYGSETGTYETEHKERAYREFAWWKGRGHKVEIRKGATK